MKLGTYTNSVMDANIKMEEFFGHIKRYRLHKALAEIGVVGMKLFSKDPSLKELNPATINEFQLAFLAKSLIQVSNDHKRENFGDKGLFACANLFNNLREPLTDMDDNLPPEQKLKGLDSFLIRMANQQFPFQTKVGHFIPRTLYLFEEIPKSLKNPSIDTEAEIHKIYNLTTRQILTVGFSIFASSEKGYLNPDYIINTQSEELKKHLDKNSVMNLISGLTADYYTLRDLFKEVETDDGLQQYAFNHLRAFPIVQTQIAGLVIPVPRWVLERITNGIFYSLMDKFKTRSSNPFLEFFGKEIFERYIGILLADHYPTNQLIKEFSYGSQNHKLSPDWIIIEGDTAIAIQCKTSGVTQQAKTTGNLDAIFADLKKRVIDAVAQTKKFVEDRALWQPIHPDLGNVKRFICVVTTYDRIYMAGTPTITKQIYPELEKLGLSEITYQILSVEEVEKLIPVLKHFSLSELIGLKSSNHKWATYEFDTFISNLIKSKGMYVDMENHRLESKYQEYLAEISPSLGLNRSNPSSEGE